LEFRPGGSLPDFRFTLCSSEGVWACDWGEALGLGEGPNLHRGVRHLRSE
jgi:hypothetical protein